MKLNFNQFRITVCRYLIATTYVASSICITILIIQNGFDQLLKD